jgi:hypothetical protein
MDRSVRTFLNLIAAGALVLSPATSVRAQDQAQSQQDQPAQQDDQAQKSSKKSKEKQKNDNQLKKELESPYRKWLDEDSPTVRKPAQSTIGFDSQPFGNAGKLHNGGCRLPAEL